MQILENLSNSDQRRADAATKLASMSDDDQTISLLIAVMQENPATSPAASGAGEAIDVLISVIREDAEQNENAIVSALASLAKLGAAEAIPHIQPLVFDKLCFAGDPYRINNAAAEALTTLGHTLEPSVLLQALGDGHPTVRPDRTNDALSVAMTSTKRH